MRYPAHIPVLVMFEKAVFYLIGMGSALMMLYLHVPFALL